MAAIAGLTLEQALRILEELSFLRAEQTKKLAYGPTQIWREENSPTYRTIAEYVNYYRGSGVTRNLAAFPPLIERVHAVMLDQANRCDDYVGNKQRLDLAANAELGVEALKRNQYQAGPEQELVATVIATIQRIKTHYHQTTAVCFERVKVKSQEVLEAQEKRRVETELENTRLKGELALWQSMFNEKVNLIQKQHIDALTQRLTEKEKQETARVLAEKDAQIESLKKQVATLEGKCQQLELGDTLKEIPLNAQIPTDTILRKIQTLLVHLAIATKKV